MKNSVIEKAYIVSGLPHIYLAPERSPGWNSLNQSYQKIRQEIETINPDLILYFSTQWLSVLGYMFQGNPQPQWHHVDANWHELGDLPYAFKVDTVFPEIYSQEVSELGHNTRVVNYEGFPIDTGTIVAQMFLNPDNKFKAAMVSCNMYSEKEENLRLGQAAARALERYGKKAVAVVVSNLSNRFEIKEIDPGKDQISSNKDDEWNRKILEMLEEGDLEDVSQCAREFSRQANADMGFRGIWWLNGLCGESNHFSGDVYDYQPVWGTGAALIGLQPTVPIRARSRVECANQEEASQAEMVQSLATREGSTWAAPEKAIPNHTMDSESPSVSGPSVQGQKIDSAQAPEPVGAYPHARREGEWLFLSGVGPRKRNSKVIPGVELDDQGEILSYDVVTQTKSVIENVKTILESAGSSLEKVVDVQVFLTNMKADFPAFNAVYAETFAAIGATRTTVEVNRLPTPIAVEFKVIAKL
ncbi:MAG: hypothetical protein KDD61_17310 [Bdellovibrionales bacterium]|nr:hypothetical protein [Bdellovibrionales bacterium]